VRIPSLLLVLCLPAIATAAEKFALKDGDRVVFLGNTLIEREQLSGWWELALTTRFHGKKITFRNLGWSGDDVFGSARAGFGDVNLGFKELKEHTLALKPTVLIIGYGNVEAFEGPAGKEKFRKGLVALLDALAPAKAKVVLLSPIAPAKLPKPLPDPTRQIENVRLYAQVVSEVASDREHTFVNLYELLKDPGTGSKAKTLDGITLTGEGYRETADTFTKALGLEDEPLEIKPGTKIKASPLRSGMRRIVASGLPKGDYSLYADGQFLMTIGSGDWERGLSLRASSEEAEQLEKLRKLIVAKNQLYFHRWRPQNVTYLTGFRKNEQGKNAREIPQFDPLVEAKEKEIAVLARPRTLKLELKPAKK
jgi:GDSL-like Lipase/Acylhydrolase family